MNPDGINEYIIREAKSKEFHEIGKLLVRVYAQLPDFPNEIDQPDYYKTLANVGDFTQSPGVKLLVASTAKNKIGGAVLYFGNMKYYGSGGSAPKQKNTAGFRLLAVDHDARGHGLGKRLSERCIEIARKENQGQMIIHTTGAMQLAWRMYERMGFKRSEDLDFMQGELKVFGFRLKL